MVATISIEEQSLLELFLQSFLFWLRHNTRRNTVEDKLQLEETTDGCFKLWTITNDSQLREFLNGKGLEYWRGGAYYEFHHELEPNIFKDKQLLYS